MKDSRASVTDTAGRATDATAAARTARVTADAGTPEPEDTVCPRCGESRDLAKVKGCIKCLQCGFKFDCNGW